MLLHVLDALEQRRGDAAELRRNQHQMRRRKPGPNGGLLDEGTPFLLQRRRVFIRLRAFQSCDMQRRDIRRQTKRVLDGFAGVPVPALYRNQRDGGDRSLKSSARWLPVSICRSNSS